MAAQERSSCERGYAISGVEKVEEDGCKIFLPGSTIQKKKGMVTDGGRVLHVVGRGKTLQEARDVAYSNIELITFEGMRFRTKIGKE